MNSLEHLIKANAEATKLRSALERIERWFREFPETRKFWDNDPSRPMSYSTCYGSNGERDFMRAVARRALTTE